MVFYEKAGRSAGNSITEVLFLKTTTVPLQKECFVLHRLLKKHMYAKVEI